ncbi:hypothetical protein C8R44DRAFT_875438 [Mycena epipterygia]|nr:hypothetical protein C8R44DRAFT_875438 [Mycena epipterygia]
MKLAVLIPALLIALAPMNKALSEPTTVEVRANNDYCKDGLDYCGSVLLDWKADIYKWLVPQMMYSRGIPRNRTRDILFTCDTSGTQFFGFGSGLIGYKDDCTWGSARTKYCKNGGTGKSDYCVVIA